MNLPANLPAIISSGAATRADRAADADTGASKFDDMLLGKPKKAARDTSDRSGENRSMSWAWSRLDLSKNTREWSVERDAAAVDADAENPDIDTAETDLADDATRSENEVDPGQPKEAEPQLVGAPVAVQADGIAPKAGLPESASPVQDLPSVQQKPVEPADEATAKDSGREAVDQRSAVRGADLEGGTRLAFQGDAEARQSAAVGATDNRRLDARTAARETISVGAERSTSAADRGAPMIPEAMRTGPDQGMSDRNERSSIGDETRQMLNAATKADGRSREDQVRSDPLSQRVTVVSSQNAPLTPPAPAPTSLVLSNPASQVVAAVREEANEISRAAAASIEAHDSTASKNRPVQTLQIQLQPADLGRVNARMSLDGAQLRVELQVETEQARAALAKDTDAILKSLKAAGFEIDRVTIQQAPPSPNASQAGTQDRGAGTFAGQDNGTDESSGRGNQRGGGNSDGQAFGDGQDATPQNDNRGGLFI